ncbi:MAG: PDZ domain-containing protein [Deltaproteobacteria bacterium]|nr:PDZ domain-containing protein [Deltaproteobacteria bacterium]
MTSWAAAGQDPLREAIDHAVSRVKPALVQIRVVTVDYPDGREKKSEAYGSGVIISKTGFVVTNHHVAGHPARLFCILSNREELEAELVGTDALSDIAVLRIKARTPREFPFAVFGDSSLVQVGDRVLAMGSPVSISQSVTLGIVSNTEMILPRMLERFGFRMMLDGEDVGSLVRWIAHDAAIYGGNSGGPLVNLRGEVIGVNEISLGLAGAIPSNLARSVANQIIEQGAVTRAWLGLKIQPQLKHAKPGAGALVSGVIGGSPAERAGFRSGDLLMALDGREVEVRFREQLPLFQQQLAELPVGRETEALVLRKGHRKVLKVTAVARQPKELKTFELKEWGMAVRNISFLAAKEMKRDGTDGVLVMSIRPGGPCGEAKPPIGPGDILIALDGKPLRNGEELAGFTRRITENREEPAPVLVEFERKAERYLTVVRVGNQEMEDPGMERKKAWLDVSTQVLTRSLAERLGLPGRTGVRLTGIYKGGSAEKAGLRVGDLIVAIDGEKIPASNDRDREVFPAMLRQRDIGQTVTLEVIRDGRESVVKAQLVRAPMLAREMRKYRNEAFEFTVRDIVFLDKADNKWEPSQRGVLVENVVTGGWASIGNLNNGDLILEVAGAEVDGLGSFKKAMKRIEEERPQSVVFHVLRGIHRLYVELEPDWDGSR